MQPTSAVTPSYVRTAGAARVAARTIPVLALLLAGTVPAEAAGPAPGPRDSAADTLSVTLAAPAAGSVREGGTAYFKLTVTGITASDSLTVTYAVSGTATPGEDYAALPGEVTLAGGVAGALIPLAAAEDTLSDGGETVTLTLSGAAGASPVALDATPATVTIQDGGASGTGNRPPLADAGRGQTVDERTVVNLDGSASEDPDGDPLSFRWTRTSGPSVGLIGANTAFPSFAAPEVARDTTIGFRLRVGDGRSYSYASTTVTVRHVNRSPEAIAGSDRTVPKRAKVTLDGSRSSDPDGDSISSYAWRQTAGPSVTLRNSTTVKPDFTAPPEEATLTFELTVSDGSLSDTDEVTMTVRNHRPDADAGEDQTVDEGDDVTLDGSGSSDPDGDDLSYAWSRVSGPDVLLSDTRAVKPTFTAPAGDATLTFELTVSDGSLSAADTVTVTVRDVEPVPNAGDDQTVDEGDLVTLDGSGSSDPGGAPLSYAWSRVSGPSVTLSDATAASPTFTAPNVTPDTDLTFRLTVSDGSLSATDDVTVTVRNAAPVPDAGPDQTVDEGDGVTLDGSGSSDPGGDDLTYRWSQTGGPSLTLSDATAVGPTLTAPNVTVDTDLTFRLTVSDGSLSATDDVTVTVRNAAPVPNAGPDQTVDEGDGVTLDGSGSSDPGGDDLTYRWSQTGGPSVTLSDATAVGPTLTAPNVTVDTDLTFRLTVSDGSLSATDDVTVTVRNAAPVPNAGPDQTVDEGDGVTLDGSGSSDPGGDDLTYRWSQTGGPSVTLSDATAASPTFTAPNVTVDTDLTFRLTVSDGSLSATDDVTVTVRHVNRAPTAEAGPDQAVDERTTVTLSGSGSDADGDSLTYAWRQLSGPSAALSDTAAASPTFTAPEVAADTSLAFELTVGDGSLSGADTVTVTVRNANRAPTADAGSDQAVDERTTVTLSGSGSDADGDSLSYLWRQLSGPSAALSDTAAASPTFTAPEVAADTSLAFELTVGDGSLSGADTVTVTVRNANRAPTAEAGPDQTVDERTTVTLSGSGSDADGDSLSYLWRQLSGPSAALSDTAGASPTFTAPEVTADTALAFLLTVSDGGLSGADTVTVTVRHVNRAPTAEAGPDQTVDERTTVRLSGSGSDADGDSLTYAWRQLSGPSAALSDTSAASPTFTAPEVSADTALAFELTVGDGSLSGADTVTVTVRNANRAPTAEAGPDQTVDERTTVRLSGSGSDADGDSLTYAWRQLSGPSAALSDTAAASPTFTAPEVAADTSLAFELTVGDGTLSGADTVTVTVRNANRPPANRPPLFNPAAATRTVAENSAAGTAVGAPVTAADPDNDALTYTLAGADASSFAIGASTGQLVVGAGAELDYESGDTTLTVLVTASDGTLADTATVTVAVTNADDPGVVTLDAAVARAGTAVTATLTDEDGSRNAGKRRRWQLSSDGGATWTNIAGATSRTYTPAAGDAGKLLRAVFTYADGHGPGKRAESAAVRVTGPNVAPVFNPATVTLTVAENSAAGAAVGAPVTATDPNGDALTYGLAGADASSFAIGAATGQLAVADGADLDYESGDTTRTVLVTASDGTLADTASVTIKVTNADDPGVLALDAAAARVGVRLTATLTDQDGSREAGKKRRWQRSSDGSTWTNIAGATTRFYTPVAGDAGKLLRVVFTYADGHGSGKRAESAAVTVAAANRAPAFSPAAATRTVAENSAAGTAVGAPVTAADPDNDALTYGLAGADASSFTIGASTGQLAVGAAADLDYESGDTTLVVLVTASDGALADTATVTVTVTNADDPGVVTLDAAVARAGTPVTATLTDQDGSREAGKRRRWQRSSDGGATWANIAGATARTYTPGTADAGKLLRAVFAYADGHGSGKRAESAAVRVTAPNVAPVFNPAAVTLTVAENSAAGAEVGAVTATDGNRDALTYSLLEGGDASSFAVGAATGRITVGSGASLDYESGDTTLVVRVAASDGTLADTAAVTVRVTNADDPGVVTLDAATARVGARLTATLTDQDGSREAGKTRRWQRSSDGGSTWTNIAGATTRSYTPVAGDAGKLLRAVFTYADGHGSGKRAESAAVTVTGPNAVPVFNPAAVTLTVAENSAAGAAVGAPVTATDPNGDALTYGLAGADASSFAIGASTGQLAVGAGADLDYESGDTTRTVLVTASDGTLADTATVTIRVTNADDPGVLTLDAAVARVGTRLAATLTDQDGSRNAGKKRRWQRSSDGSTWTNIAGARTRFHTPAAGDAGKLLRAVFTYADGHGSGKRAESAAVRVVGATTPVVSFGAGTYSAAPGGSANVAVLMSPAAAAPLVVGVAIGGSAPAATDSVTFRAGDASRTLAVSAAGLSAGDTVLVSFGALPSGAVAAAPSEARVIVRAVSADAGRRNRKPAPLVAAFAEPAYAAVAGGAGASVAVRLSPPADREVVVPVAAAGAAAALLDVPGSVRFAPGDTVAAFTVAAPAGTPAGAVALGFGELPDGVSAGTVAGSVIDIVSAGADAGLDESMAVGLAVLGRAVAEGARGAVAGRIEARMRGGSGSSSGAAGEWAGRAAGMLASLAGPRTGPGPTGREAIERLLPQVSFSADIGGREPGSAPRFGVWGEGSARGFRGEPGGIAYDGGMRALTVGADVRLGTGAGVGLAVMRSGAELDHASSSLEGTMSHDMTTVHPYLFLRPAPGLGLWAMAGYGTGGLETAGATPARDAALRMVSGGARLPLARRGAFGLGLAGDVFGVRMDAGDDGSAGGAVRGRALVEATYAANGLEVGVEAGGRYDGGDADTGAGAEAGASLAYAGGGLNAALNGRMAVGSGGHREWGAALRLAWDPGARDRGFRLVVSPGHGHDRSGVRRLLDDGLVAGGAVPRNASRIDAEAGYGIAAFGGGSLGAYGRFSARDGTRAWTLGAGYDLGGSVRFNLEAVRAGAGTAPVRQGLRAGLDVRF